MNAARTARVDDQLERASAPVFVHGDCDGYNQLCARLARPRSLWGATTRLAAAEQQHRQQRLGHRRALGLALDRGPSGALRARLPMTITEFRGSPEARQRYWARAHIGWRRIAAARPNAGHRAVAALQQAGVLHGIITQNVDGLHQAAGARDVLELHGTLDWVVCLECGARSTRESLDQRLRTANPNLSSDELPASNPDGDAELADQHVARFRVVGCECRAAELLKPDVVFFGENVPRPRVQRCFDLLDDSACLLVLGSSLTVMSGLRFVHRARQARIPVAIVNRGATRGDPLADIKVDAALGEVLPILAGVPQ